MSLYHSDNGLQITQGQNIKRKEYYQHTTKISPHVPKQ